MHTLALSLIVLVAVLAGIYLLARQSTHDTGELAWRVEQLLLRVVPPTGTGSQGEPTWCGLTIRRLAHVAEYALLGGAALAVACAVCGAGWRAALLAGALCLAASLADELHKCFVPGRHFDAADLLLDAVSYLLTIGLGIAFLQVIATLQ